MIVGKRKHSFGVIARGGKSKNFTDVIALDGGTVGVAHFAAGGLGALYDSMGDSIVKNIFHRITVVSILLVQ